MRVKELGKSWGQAPRNRCKMCALRIAEKIGEPPTAIQVIMWREIMLYYLANG